MHQRIRFAVVCACAGATGSILAAGTPLDDPIPTPVPTGNVHIALTTVSTGLTAPNWGVHAPATPVAGAASQRFFVTDQNGVLWSVELPSGAKSVFLDVSARLVSLGIGGPGSFDERGLLGVAFHPDYATNGLLYTYTSQPVDGPADYSTMPEGTNANHQSVVTEWAVPDPTDPASVVDPTSDRELLRIDQPQFNHDGGGLAFGPDGLLYISLGDGGAADDQGTGHGETGNGQDATNVLGTLLRIDPLGSNAPNGAYGIPADNPFVGAGPSTIPEEIYAYGFRNPFRFSFDTETGDLYVADVGQHALEEIDIVEPGGNYGWNLKEGSFFFNPNGADNGYVTDVDPGVPPGLIDPFAEYDHDEGIAIIGGFVYRGCEIPQLYGHYVFGDYRNPASPTQGRLFYLGDGAEVLELPIVGQTGPGVRVLGFGQDATGELYVLGNLTGTPFGSTGVIYRIALSTGDLDASGAVDGADLRVLLGDWGMESCASDINNDGVVNGIDLAFLLGAWTIDP